jgi:2-phospho-L-lactate guanylyltransferase
VRYSVSGGRALFVCAVVPVKDLDASKKRLSSVLSPQERGQLTLAMLEDVLSALKTSEVDETLVVSNDLMVQGIARKFDVRYLAQKAGGLNSAIEEATKWCVQEEAEAVLVLPADIPLLSSGDVDKMIELGGCEERAVVLSPSRDGGTNALFLSPPELIHVCFGQGSFAKHIKEAEGKGVDAILYNSTNLAIDIDSVEDLRKMLIIESNTIFRKVLGQFNLGRRLGEVFQDRNRRKLSRIKQCMM